MGADKESAVQSDIERQPKGSATQGLCQSFPFIGYYITTTHTNDVQSNTSRTDKKRITYRPTYLHAAGTAKPRASRHFSMGRSCTPSTLMRDDRDRRPACAWRIWQKCLSPARVIGRRRKAQCRKPHFRTRSSGSGTAARRGHGGASNKSLYHAEAYATNLT